MTSRVLRPRASMPDYKGAEELDKPQQLSSPPATPAPAKRVRGRNNVTPKAPQTPVNDSASTKNSRKRRRSSVKVKEDPEDLPHNLGKPALPTPAINNKHQDAPPSKKRTRTPKSVKSEVTADADVQALAAKVGLKTAQSPTKKPNKAKEHALQPGVSPYPTYPHPTPEECHEVTRILSKLHGEVAPPAQIPVPSLTVAGCGEVPSVLDALVRTRLSANTSGNNSSRAFQGIVKRFGLKESGIGKGSVDWDVVRRSSVNDLEESIRAGGLSKIKSKDIKSILDMVYEENQSRAAALRNTKDDPEGAERESDGEKHLEVAKADEGVLSLDHLHLLEDEDVFKKLVSYPGIGAKTASCVMLFCLRRESFAVDTHVFRLCRWLGWVPSQEWVDEQNAVAAEEPAAGEEDGGTPKKKAKKFKGMPKVDRDNCFHHCEARVPDELKYPLHQLLIKHGKSCPRCRAITGEASKDWSKGCVIEKLVTRDGVKKGSGKKQVEEKSEEESEWEEDDMDD